jgi:hypothetical protein
MIGATVAKIFNPMAGLIISLSNWDPNSQVDGTAAYWPPLHRYSDVTWEQAKVVPDSNVGNLRYWIRHHIANSDTLGIIDSLFSGVGPLNQLATETFGMLIVVEQEQCTSMAGSRLRHVHK